MCFPGCGLVFCERLFFGNSVFLLIESILDPSYHSIFFLRDNRLYFCHVFGVIVCSLSLTTANTVAIHFAEMGWIPMIPNFHVRPKVFMRIWSSNELFCVCRSFAATPTHIPISRIVRASSIILTQYTHESLRHT